VKLFVLDPHAIYRQGLVSCLTAMADVTSVADAGSVQEARERPELAEADVVLVDVDVAGAYPFMRNLRDTTSARTVVCTSRSDDNDVLAGVQAGAIGYLCKETLTPAALTAAVNAAANGAGVMEPSLLGTFLRGVTRASQEVLEPRGLSLSRLTAREQEVLRLVAAGHPTREVARQLSYSERTIKNVIHDIVTKFNARTRSQAVAEAVRAGLI
jgi:DNA-binding NarL/FixJ family response regulator